ncbi:transcriptional regulator [Roseibium denhamense]|uniref:Transcriptional regulator, HxlR family n=1 Tax=Roseibium denhamense TaxID=76305 RepID=A0ABY1P7Z1_9HYPH|nr:helix-turn-helix domain-containing protein [Roseibium denhamense]MTI07252.1 transcriptional regulator [Roseibium denhamense]SMP26251.1 transcriptional regulator, HxlR family [Roseibium denhamense]
MKITSRQNCPIRRATSVLSDQWSFLIIREFFLEGKRRRFQDLQSELGLSPNTLSNRLKRLEQQGVIERQIYSDHPPRAEYVLTSKGNALAPIMNALYDWGTEYPDTNGEDRNG